MCLFALNTTPNLRIKDLKQTAAKNIKVWKIFTVKEEKTKKNDFITNISNYRFYSPFQIYEYHLGHEYNTVIRRDMFFNGIGRGFHSYTNKKAAITKKSLCQSVSKLSYIIIPCIIPKGASYILGTRDEIVSDRLKLPKSFTYNNITYYI